MAKVREMQFKLISISSFFFSIEQAFGVEYSHPLRASPRPLTCDQLEKGCPICDAPEQCSPRVRRSWSTLNDSEKQRVINALHIMKWTSDEDGKSSYGGNFRRYDELILHHATAENDRRGDQAHLSEGFTFWHRLFLLEAENSLLSIDPKIGALPYFDLREDLSNFFGDTSLHFGSITGTGFNSSIGDGGFANWTVSEYDEYLQSVSIEKNVSSLFDGLFNNFTGRTLLRKSNVPTDAIVRYATCGTPPGPDLYSSADFEACVNETEFINFYWCLESPLTNGAHEITHFTVGSADSPTLGFGCPDFAPPVIEATGTRQGDFLDKSTSVNDPIFFLHHAFVDMITMKFMESTPDGNNYWSFQAERAEGTPFPVDGSMLYDIVNEEWPFYGSDLLSDTDAPQGALQFWEVMCWLGPSTSLYTYDIFDKLCSVEETNSKNTTGENSDKDTTTKEESSTAVSFAIGILFATGTTIAAAIVHFVF